MRKYLLGTALVAALTGCTADWDPGRESKGSSTTAEAEAVKFHLPRHPAQSFASLPDQGELLSYDGDRQVRKAGAYTLLPVNISEEHAFNAITKGEMVVPGPSGEPVRLTYASHEEHSDGSWTWVGQDESGKSSVLTFGEDAVFGRIASGDDVFGVRTNPDGAWLVQTERTKLAGLGGRPEASQDDFLHAPGDDSEVLLDPAVSGAGPVLEAAAASVAPKAASVVVDLVLGYTNGFVAQLGSQSAAMTNLNNLIAVANQAYLNSGINYRLRLVRAVQVNYSDSSTNEDTLRKLTGYDERTSQSVAVDPAFSALRAARDEYGGDLVSLVRPHRSPEQKGCGIAWLLGANGRTITTARDAAFGYSVVSVGIDMDEDGQNYLCPEDTLAHELGHNMGQTHDVDNVGKVNNVPTYGAHTYSYGYREDSTAGFHTIMAYPLANSQVSILNFANPAVSVSGRRTGVANSADNARSMNQTMPIVSSFRSSIVPVDGEAINDFNQDGRSDILWRQDRSGAENFRIWTMKGGARLRAYQYTMSADYRVVATGDFKGNGALGIVWRAGQSTRLRMWQSTGSAFTTSWVEGLGGAWDIVAVGDVNGDGKDDFLWRQRDGASKNFRVWLMDGDKKISELQFNMSLDYSLVAIGDFNDDGKLDLVWRSGQSSQLRFWMGKGSSFDTSWVTGLGAGWNIEGVGDVDGDGKSDLLWRSTSASSQNFRIWLMNGTTRSSERVHNMALSYKLVATGDFDGDGRLDLVWRTGESADYRFWMGSLAGFDASWVSAFGAGWAPIHLN